MSVSTKRNVLGDLLKIFKSDKKISTGREDARRKARRSLRLETLEKRELLAVMIGNFALAETATDSGQGWSYVGATEDTSGVLTLENYNNGQIVATGQNLTIKIKGNANSLSVGNSESNSSGIKVTGGDLTIEGVDANAELQMIVYSINKTAKAAIDVDGDLTIQNLARLNIQSTANGVALGITATGNATFKDNANVTIHVTPGLDAVRLTGTASNLTFSADGSKTTKDVYKFLGGAVHTGSMSFVDMADSSQPKTLTNTGWTPDSGASTSTPLPITMDLIEDGRTIDYVANTLRSLNFAVFQSAGKTTNILITANIELPDTALYIGRSSATSDFVSNTNVTLLSSGAWTLKRAGKINRSVICVGGTLPNTADRSIVCNLGTSKGMGSATLTLDGGAVWTDVPLVDANATFFSNVAGQTFTVDVGMNYTFTPKPVGSETPPTESSVADKLFVVDGSGTLKMIQTTDSGVAHYNTAQYDLVGTGADGEGTYTFLLDMSEGQGSEYKLPYYVNVTDSSGTLMVASRKNTGLARTSSVLHVSGTANMYDGVFVQNGQNNSRSGSDCAGGVYVSGNSESNKASAGGLFNMYGGEIRYNESAQGGGVNVQGEMNMYGGKIYGNAAKSQHPVESYEYEDVYGAEGAGIRVRCGNLTINDGEIYENCCYGMYQYESGVMENGADAKGGGIHNSADSNTFFNGGSIRNNYSTSYGGGVFAGGNGTGNFEMDGGEIVDNIANQGGGIYMNSGVRLTGGSIAGNVVAGGKNASVCSLVYRSSSYITFHTTADGKSWTSTAGNISTAYGPGIFARSRNNDEGPETCPSMTIGGGIVVDSNNAVFVFMNQNYNQNKYFVPIYVESELTASGACMLLDVNENTYKTYSEDGNANRGKAGATQVGNRDVVKFAPGLALQPGKFTTSNDYLQIIPNAEGLGTSNTSANSLAFNYLGVYNEVGAVDSPENNFMRIYARDNETGEIVNDTNCLIQNGAAVKMYVEYLAVTKGYKNIELRMISSFSLFNQLVLAEYLPSSESVNLLIAPESVETRRERNGGEMTLCYSLEDLTDSGYTQVGTDLFGAKLWSKATNYNYISEGDYTATVVDDFQCDSATNCVILVNDNVNLTLNDGKSYLTIDGNYLASFDCPMFVVYGNMTMEANTTLRNATNSNPVSSEFVASAGAISVYGARRNYELLEKSFVDGAAQATPNGCSIKEVTTETTELGEGGTSINVYTTTSTWTDADQLTTTVVTEVANGEIRSTTSSTVDVNEVAADSAYDFTTAIAADGRLSLRIRSAGVAATADATDVYVYTDLTAAADAPRNAISVVSTALKDGERYTSIYNGSTITASTTASVTDENDLTSTTTFTEGTGDVQKTTTVVTRVLGGEIIATTTRTVDAEGLPATSDFTFYASFTAVENEGQKRVRLQILNPNARDGYCDVFYVYTDPTMGADEARNVVKEAGMYYVSCPGVLSMNSGCDILKCVGSDAGAVAVVNGAVFNMTGGTISDCTGGVAGVWGASPFSLSGAGAVKVYQSSAYRSLGNIVYHDGTDANETSRYQFTKDADVKLATFNFSGGTLVGNRGEYGGAIWNDAVVKMTGGNIYGNVSEYVGALATINPGVPSTATYTPYGNGVYQNGVFELSGSAYIGNPDSETPQKELNGVYLKTGRVVNIVGKWTGNEKADPLYVESEDESVGTTLVVLNYDAFHASVDDSVANAAAAVAVADAQKLLDERKVVRLTYNPYDENGIIEGTRNVANDEIVYDLVVTTPSDDNGTFSYDQQRVRFLNTLVIGLATLQYGNNSTDQTSLNYITNTGDHVGGDLVSIKTFNETGLSSVDPNYTFVGWNTKANGSGTWIYPGDNNQAIYATGTLFAIWKEDAGLVLTTQDDEFDLTWNSTEGKWNENYGTFLSLREAIVLAEQRAVEAKAADSTAEVYQSVSFSPNEWMWEHVQIVGEPVVVSETSNEPFDESMNYKDVTTRTTSYNNEKTLKYLKVETIAYSNLRQVEGAWTITKTVTTTDYTFSEWVFVQGDKELTLTLAATLPTISTSLALSGESFYAGCGLQIRIDGATTIAVDGKSEAGDRYQYDDPTNPTMANRSDNAKSGQNVRILTVDAETSGTASMNMSAVFGDDVTGASGYYEKDDGKTVLHYTNREGMKTWIAIEVLGENWYEVTASSGRTVTSVGDGKWTVATLNDSGENVGLESFDVTPSAESGNITINTLATQDNAATTLATTVVYNTLATMATVNSQLLVGRFVQNGAGAFFDVQQQANTKIEYKYTNRNGETVDFSFDIGSNDVTVASGGTATCNDDGSYSITTVAGLETFLVKRESDIVTATVTTTDKEGRELTMEIKADASTENYVIWANSTSNYVWENPVSIENFLFENGGGIHDVDARINAQKADTEVVLNSGHGGAIFVSPTSKLLVAKSEFRRCAAESEKVGGAIANRGALTLADVVFNENGGGTIMLNADNFPIGFSTDPTTRYGGALYNQGTATIYGNCEFELNGATEAGGAIYNSGALALTDDSSVYRNVSNGDGGGIYNYNTNGTTKYLTLTDVVVSGNLALGSHTDANGKTDGFGGALMNYAGLGVTLTNVLMDYNTAKRNGGAICNASSGTIADQNEKRGSISLSNCQIDYNSAQYGGGILNGGVASIYGSSFTANKAAFNGGAISNTDHIEALTLEEAKEAINKTNGSDLYIYDSSSTGSVTLFVANTAGGYGGALSDWGRICVIGGSTTFDATNTAKFGGALSYASYSTLLGTLGKDVNVKVNGATKQVEWVNVKDITWDAQSTTDRPVEMLVKSGSLNATDRVVIAVENGASLELSKDGVFSMADLGATETGFYKLTVSILDKRGVLTGEQTIEVFVDFAPPAVSVALNDRADGSILSMNIAVESNKANPVYEWRVNWGDGSEKTVLRSFGYSIDASHYYVPQSTRQNYVVTLELIDSDGKGEGAAFVVATQTVEPATSDLNQASFANVSNATVEANVAEVLEETPLVSFAVLSVEADENASILYETPETLEVKVPVRRNVVRVRQNVEDYRAFADRALSTFVPEDENLELDAASWNAWRDFEAAENERVGENVFESLDLEALFVGIDG